MSPETRQHAKHERNRPVRQRARACLPLVPFLTAGLAGCDRIDGLFGDAPESVRATYVAGLVEAGLAATPMAQSWIAAGDDAIAAAEPLGLPVRRSGWFDVDSAASVAVRLTAPDARWVTIRARLAGGASGRLFVDALRIPADPERAPVTLASAGDSAQLVWFRVRGDDDIVVRIQPELLRGGAWELEIGTQQDEPVATGSLALETTR